MYKHLHYFLKITVNSLYFYFIFILVTLELESCWKIGVGWG